MFIAVVNQEQVVAQVTDHSFVLEDQDYSHEAGMERTCEAADISHEVQDAIDLSSDDLQIAVKLEAERHLHVVIVVVRAQRPEPGPIRAKYLALASHSRYVVAQVKLRHLQVVDDF